MESSSAKAPTKVEVPTNTPSWFLTIYLFIYLFGVLRRFQHCTGHITTGSWKGRGNQYIEFARVVYCKLPTNGKQLPAFPLKAVTGIEPPTSEVGVVSYKAKQLNEHSRELYQKFYHAFSV